MPRKIEKEIQIFLIGLAMVSCLGGFMGVPQDGQGIESVVLFLKNFAIIFSGLALIVIAVVAVSLWVVLNK